MDMEINQYIDNMPEGCIDYEKDKKEFPDLEPKAGCRYYYKYFNTKALSDAFKKAIENACKGDGNQGDHSTWGEFDDLTEAEREVISQQVDREVLKAADRARRAGNLPGELADYIGELEKVEPAVFNWKAYFRRLLGTTKDYNTKSTRKRSSKRFEEIAPGKRHIYKQKLLVAVDTSGSVRNEELLEFFNEIYHIYKAGAVIDILEYDFTVNRIYEYNGKFDGNITGRGGTNFDAPIEMFNQNRRLYSALVMFTDGFCNINLKPLGECIWVITSEGSVQDYPGYTVYIPNNK